MPVTLATSMRTSNESYFKCPREPSRLQNCSLQAQLRPVSPLTDEPRSQSGNWSGDPGGFCHDICSWSDFQCSDDPMIIPVISAATGEGGGRFFYRGSSLCVLARNSRLLLMQWKPLWFCGSTTNIWMCQSVSPGRAVSVSQRLPCPNTLNPD